MFWREKWSGFSFFQDAAGEPNVWEFADSLELWAVLSAVIPKMADKSKKILILIDFNVGTYNSCLIAIV